ncbi:MAG: ORF6N domain-containing protein, partial [Acetatifactor sp.]
EDFMFQLTTEEDGFLKSQIATSSWGGKRKLPYAFTEQGIYMLATVLRGELAEQQSIYVVDDYVNTKTLQLLSQKQAGVEVILFTENGHGKEAFSTAILMLWEIKKYEV